MSDQLADSAERLFTANTGKAVIRAAEDGAFPHVLWSAVSEAGFTAALLPEHAGGFGATVVEAMSLLRISAAHAAPIPLAETMLAGWLLAQAGLPVPEGVLTLAPVRTKDVLRLDRTADGWRLAGTAARIPWARDADVIVVLAEGPDGPAVALLRGGSTVSHDRNLAGEPRDTIVVDASLPIDAVAPAPSGFGPAQLRAAGAVVRTVQIAGALARTLALSVQYAQTRVQFGRPIGKFQAIQHKLADMATDIDASRLLTQRAAWMKDSGQNVNKESAMAKLFASETAVRVADEAVQVHGGYGFLKDYPVEKFYRDVKLCTIGEGTSEIQRLVIARQLLNTERQHG